MPSDDDVGGGMGFLLERVELEVENGRAIARGAPDLAQLVDRLPELLAALNQRGLLPTTTTPAGLLVAVIGPAFLFGLVTELYAIRDGQQPLRSAN